MVRQVKPPPRTDGLKATAQQPSERGSADEFPRLKPWGSITSPESQSRSVSQVDRTSLGISVGFHVLLALVMASIVFRSVQDNRRSAIVSTIAESPAGNEVIASVSTSIGQQSTASNISANRMATRATQSAPIVRPDSSASALRDAQPVVLTSTFDGHETDVIGAVRTAEESEITGELNAATHDDLSSVADVLTAEVRENALFSDVVVLWLLDRSVSMQRQHELLSDELKPFFDSFDSKAEAGHVVLHTAVAFGLEVNEIRKPTTNGHAVAAAMRKSVEIDPSGVENICTAIARTVIEYRERRPRYRDHRLVCFVLTDESGDDMGQLDATIDVCRRADCSVTVVGPSAVLGASGGFHQYTAARGQDAFHLAVRRGPETPDRYRAFIPRWEPRYRLRSNGRVNDFNAPDAWEGGPYFRGLSSGMPAYELARLTAETGGQYIQFDRPDDRPPYEQERLQQYLPVPPETHDAATVRVRDAVMEMVSEVNAVTSQMVLPDAFGTYTASGPTAHRLLTSQMTDALARAAQMLDQVKTLRQEFDAAADKDDIAQCLPRWRASHQLIKAQLVEMESRVTAYIEAIRGIGKLHNTTNSVRVNMTNSGQPRVAGAKARAAQDLFAAIEEEHAGTPWAVLAKLEREFMTSVSAYQYKADPPVVESAPTTPEAVPPRL